MNFKSKLVIGILVFLLIAALLSAIYFWVSGQNAPVVSTSSFIETPKIKAVEKIKTVYVKSPPEIRTVEKEVVIEKLALPDWAKAQDKQMIATAEIQPYAGKTNAVTILDMKTGVAEILAKQEPLPFFGFIQDKDVYVRAGYSTGAEVQVTVGGHWRFLRIGAVRIGAFAEVSNRSGGEAVGGVEISY